MALLPGLESGSGSDEALTSAVAVTTAEAVKCPTICRLALEPAASVPTVQMPAPLA
jgi:hypothetical protein